LHADGVLKYPKNYEGFDPSEVGLTRHMVLGKHSGGHGLQSRLQQLGIHLDNDKVNILLQQVRAISQKNKRCLADDELLSLVAHPTMMPGVING
jgi:homocitrate synthase NifV